MFGRDCQMGLSRGDAMKVARGTLSKAKLGVYYVTLNESKDCKQISWNLDTNTIPMQCMQPQSYTNQRYTPINWSRLVGDICDSSVVSTPPESWQYVTIPRQLAIRKHDRGGYAFLQLSHVVSNLIVAMMIPSYPRPHFCCIIWPLVQSFCSMHSVWPHLWV